ncbi:unnamed protein product, partial [marine sediment metagenome]
GSAYSLQEMLTIKSDDVVGRANAYDSIIKGHPIQSPHIPSAFNVLVSELKSLGFSISPVVKKPVIKKEVKKPEKKPKEIKKSVKAEKRKQKKVSKEKKKIKKSRPRSGSRQRSGKTKK